MRPAHKCTRRESPITATHDTDQQSNLDTQIVIMEEEQKEESETVERAEEETELEVEQELDDGWEVCISFML